MSIIAQTNKHIAHNAIGIPNRVNVGVGNQTIEFPTSYFFGDPKDFDFTRMQEKYAIVAAALERVGFNIVRLGVCTVQQHYRGYPAGNPKMFTLVAGTADGIEFVWHKFESCSQGAGHNYIYANGVKLHLSSFLSYSEAEQDQFLDASEFRITLRKMINEAE